MGILTPSEQRGNSLLAASCVTFASVPCKVPIKRSAADDSERGAKGKPPRKSLRSAGKQLESFWRKRERKKDSPVGTRQLGARVEEVSEKNEIGRGKTHHLAPDRKQQQAGQKELKKIGGAIEPAVCV